MISATAALIAAFFSSLASQPGDTLLSAVNQSTKKGLLSPKNSSENSENSSDSISYSKSNLIENNNYDESSEGGLKLEIRQQNKSKIIQKIDDIPQKVELESPITVMKNTINELGFKGLFKGTKARLLHVSFYVVVQFLVYDFVKQSVGLAVTGLH